jgi:hypothetical protein
MSNTTALKQDKQLLSDIERRIAWEKRQLEIPFD